MVLIFRDFLTQQECNLLNNWVDIGVKNKWLDKGYDKPSSLVNDAAWNYDKRLTTRNYGDRFNYPKIVYDVFKKITDFLELSDLEKSVSGRGKDGVVVSCTFHGGNVFPHKDPKEDLLEILRCNIMTRSADFGGVLFIDNKEININVGDLHCYLPSLVEHYVTTVNGNTQRVLWMFGYQCSKERFDKLCLLQKQI